ncbi:hypothetical protein [Thaumasiovibrio sp. DFM-14]|uniref:hypothetical protein n=1 Tax=Thaumasiovibrio sp. DFM-14 TaxID=3384792 RepID=UPI00399F880B
MSKETIDNVNVEAPATVSAEDAVNCLFGDIQAINAKSLDAVVDALFVHATRVYGEEQTSMVVNTVMAHVIGAVMNRHVDSVGSYTMEEYASILNDSGNAFATIVTATAKREHSH